MICDAHKIELPVWETGSERDCVVDFCKNLMDTARKESCGKCVLCRDGTWQVYEMFKDITEGNAKSEDFDLAAELLELIRENAGCDMSRDAAAMSLELMERHAEEWDRHIRRKRCTNMVCKASYTLYVDPAVCDGCGACLAACPSGAIAGGEGMIHVIDVDACSKSLNCVRTCPKGAIKKAGPVKPKVPAEPIPTGSFESASGGEDDGTSRRRRRRRS